MSKQGKGREEEASRGFFDKLMVTLFVMFALALVALGGAAFLTFVVLADNEDFTQSNNTEASTRDLEKMFEAYGLARTSMPDIMPIMQSVDNRSVAIDVKNMLYGTAVDNDFVDRSDSWVAFSLQMEIKNPTNQPIEVSDTVWVLADNVRQAPVDVSNDFLGEYNLRNLNDATIGAGESLSGFVSFYVRLSSVHNMFLQINRTSGSPMTIDISKK